MEGQNSMRIDRDRNAQFVTLIFPFLFFAFTLFTPHSFMQLLQNQGDKVIEVVK